MNRRDLLKSSSIQDMETIAISPDKPDEHVTQDVPDKLELSDLHEGDTIRITLDAIVGDTLFDSQRMNIVGALIYLKLSHDSIWITDEDDVNISCRQ